ncbi:hypothetical protein MBRA1_003387 [Malassezia brasiliensis]|uniref:Uncharacterized protein n=1 Tax=Malassezia brasiliensis TaxID=1821822 RepID=A0AAF0DUS1_9BASI|nr:hypothetical protein MBRA1_003387 [Malassezia brasiliensis]
MASMPFTTSVPRARRDQPDDLDFDNPLSNILEDDTLPIRIAKVTAKEIKLADGLVVPSPCIFLNGKVFLWNPPKIDPMTAMPNGKGWESWNSVRYRKIDMQRNACSTYNLLSEEGRSVAAAILPAP